MDLDERLLRLILSRFLQWRTRPPTIASFLFSFRSWPLLAMVGTTMRCVARRRWRTERTLLVHRGLLRRLGPARLRIR